MIFVTGGNGFVGRSVVRALLNQGERVTLLQGNVTNRDALRNQLRDVETIVHLATAERRGHARRLFAVDVEGTEGLLHAAEAVGVQRIVFLSRLNADPYANFPLLRAKGLAERMLRQSALRWTVVRTATLFGEGDQLTGPITRFARRTWPFAWLPAGGVVALQPLWVENLAHIVRDVVRRYDLDEQVLSVAGEERLHYAEIVRLSLDAARLARQPLKVPLAFIQAAAVPGRLRRYPLLSPFFIHRFSTPEVLPLDAVRRQFDLRPARMVDQLGYLRPRGRWR